MSTCNSCGGGGCSACAFTGGFIRGGGKPVRKIGLRHLAERIVRLKAQVAELERRLAEANAKNEAQWMDATVNKVDRDLYNHALRKVTEAESDLDRLEAECAAMRSEIVRIRNAHLDELECNHDLTPEVAIEIKKRIAQLDNLLDR